MTTEHMPIATEDWRKYRTIFGCPLTFSVDIHGAQVDLVPALYFDDGDLRLDNNKALELYRAGTAKLLADNSGPTTKETP